MSWWGPGALRSHKSAQNSGLEELNMDVIALLDRDEPGHPSPLGKRLFVWANGVDCPTNQVLREWVSAHASVIYWRPEPRRSGDVQPLSGPKKRTDE
jgi:hypothetical protein